MEQATQATQKIGHWTIDRDDNRTWDRVRFICSACGEWQTYGKTKYCPECGAKMEKEDAEKHESCENPHIYECSCGYGWDKSKVVRHHFCPNCGRKVQEAKE